MSEVLNNIKQNISNLKILISEAKKQSNSNAKEPRNGESHEDTRKYEKLVEQVNSLIERIDSDILQCKETLKEK
jgi:hypothetical protein